MDIAKFCRKILWVLLLANLCFKAIGFQEKIDFSQSSDMMKEEIKAVLEMKFLSILGLPFKPEKPKNKIKVPAQVWKLYYKWLDDAYEDLDKRNADTIQFLHHKEADSYIDEGSEQKGIENLQFEITLLNQSDKFHRAELYIFSEPHSNLGKRIPYRVSIYYNNDTIPFIVRKIVGSRFGFSSIDVTKIVRQKLENNSLSNPILNIGISLNDHLHLRRRRNTDNDEWQSKRPVLVIYSLAGEKTRKSKKKPQRVKRSTFNKSVNNEIKKDTCHLHPFEFDLVKVGWNEFVLAPLEYELNYCAGYCPHPLSHHYNITNHAVIQNTVLKIMKGQVPPLCCIPSKLEKTTVVYLDHKSKIVIKRPDNMIATACGCR